MKPPYFQERSLPHRVNKYMNEHKHIDLEDMTDYLINNYREFRGKNKKAFMRSVEKAFEWHLYCRKQNEESSDIEDIIDSDGGGSDVMDITESEHPVKQIPFISGLLGESNAVFAVFKETHAKDNFDSEMWLLGYNLFQMRQKEQAT
nr:uncharacterized protein LOC128706517 [Cherax quadricarinatus]